jgi:hypothetical protein
MQQIPRACRNICQKTKGVSLIGPHLQKDLMIIHPTMVHVSMAIMVAVTIITVAPIMVIPLEVASILRDNLINITSVFYQRLILTIACSSFDRSSMETVLANFFKSVTCHF